MADLATGEVIPGGSDGSGGGHGGDGIGKDGAEGEGGGVGDVAVIEQRAIGDGLAEEGDRVHISEVPAGIHGDGIFLGETHGGVPRDDVAEGGGGNVAQDIVMGKRSDRAIGKGLVGHDMVLGEIKGEGSVAEDIEIVSTTCAIDSDDEFLRLFVVGHGLEADSGEGGCAGIHIVEEAFEIGGSIVACVGRHQHVAVAAKHNAVVGHRRHIVQAEAQTESCSLGNGEDIVAVTAINICMDEDGDELRLRGHERSDSVLQRRNSVVILIDIHLHELTRAGAGIVVDVEGGGSLVISISVGADGGILQGYDANAEGVLAGSKAEVLEGELLVDDAGAGNRFVNDELSNGSAVAGEFEGDTRDGFEAVVLDGEADMHLGLIGLVVVRVGGEVHDGRVVVGQVATADDKLHGEGAGRGIVIPAEAIGVVGIGQQAIVTDG